MHRGLREVCDGRVLYLDMNSFFASVEQQRNPSLRHQPVAVVSHAGSRGTVLAASYEAKRFGVQTGLRLAVARELCPSLLATEPNPALYTATHRRFMMILRSLFGPEVQARSIDEAALYLAPNQYGSARCHELAVQIKQRFRQQLGECIRCSIGIAPNSFLAKLATNLQKPDGLVEIKAVDIPEVLARLSLTDLPGIADRNAFRLAEHGIASPLHLYRASADQLHKQFGIWGQYWWWRLHGYETECGPGPPKSMSHQHVLKQWLHREDEVWPVVARMTDHLIHRLRRNNWRCQSVFLGLSLERAAPLLADYRFPSPTSQYFTLIQTIEALLRQFTFPLAGSVRKITIGFYALQEERNGLQLDLFDTAIRGESLSQAVESIRARFGFESIRLGETVHLHKNVAKEQIGFGRIRDRH